MTAPVRLRLCRKRRPKSEQERERARATLRMPKRWGTKSARPRSLWWFDIHRTCWRSHKFRPSQPRYPETLRRAEYALAAWLANRPVCEEA